MGARKRRERKKKYEFDENMEKSEQIRRAQIIAEVEAAWHERHGLRGNRRGRPVDAKYDEIEKKIKQFIENPERYRITEDGIEFAKKPTIQKNNSPKIPKIKSSNKKNQKLLI